MRNSQKQPTRLKRHASPKSWSRKKHQDWAPSISRIHCNENLGLVTRNSTSLIDEGIFFGGGAHIFKPLGVSVLAQENCSFRPIAMEFGPLFCSHNLPVTLKIAASVYNPPQTTYLKSRECHPIKKVKSQRIETVLKT